jgi:hypothetical protein
LFEVGFHFGELENVGWRKIRRLIKGLLMSTTPPFARKFFIIMAEKAMTLSCKGTNFLSKLKPHSRNQIQ